MIIVRPEPIALVTNGAENLLTPSPKEVYVAPGVGFFAVGIDLGAVRTIDTIFLGFTNALNASFAVDLTSEFGGGTSETIVDQPVRALDAIGPVHGLALLPAPRQARYLRVRAGGDSVPFTAGIFMAGARFQAPHERGGGRQPIDTGTKELLPDGGVGGEDGVVLCSLKWRFVGLPDAIRRQLWALVYDRGERGPVLVIEEPDTEAAGANERIHYGTFDRFDAYERRDPNDTAWALSMTEWL